MIIRISKKATDEEIQKAFESFSKRKKVRGFQPKKYFGKLVRGLNGLKYQKLIRNEWD